MGIPTAKQDQLRMLRERKASKRGPSPTPDLKAAVAEAVSRIDSKAARRKAKKSK